MLDFLVCCLCLCVFANSFRDADCFNVYVCDKMQLYTSVFTESTFDERVNAGTLVELSFKAIPRTIFDSLLLDRHVYVHTHLHKKMRGKRQKHVKWHRKEHEHLQEVKKPRT